MKVNGRDIRFMRTVKANCILADHAPDGDITKYTDIWESGDYKRSQEASAVFISALSDGYESFKAFSEPGYKPNPISYDEAISLPDDLFNDLFMESLKAFQEDGKITVETEADPGKKTDGSNESES